MAMNEQPTSKRILHIALVMAGLSFMLGCVGLPLATFVPQLAHLTFWNGHTLSDVVAGSAMAFSIGTIYVSRWPTYAPAWKRMRLRWKLACGSGGILTVCSFVGMQAAIAMLPHPQLSTLSELGDVLIWMVLILCGLVVFSAGFAHLITAFFD